MASRPWELTAGGGGRAESDTQITAVNRGLVPEWRYSPHRGGEDRQGLKARHAALLLSGLRDLTKVPPVTLQIWGRRSPSELTPLTPSGPGRRAEALQLLSLEAGRSLAELAGRAPRANAVGPLGRPASCARPGASEGQTDRRGAAVSAQRRRCPLSSDLGSRCCR